MTVGHALLAGVFACAVGGQAFGFEPQFAVWGAHCPARFLQLVDVAGGAGADQVGQLLAGDVVWVGHLDLIAIRHTIRLRSQP